MQEDLTKRSRNAGGVEGSHFSNEAEVGRSPPMPQSDPGSSLPSVAWSLQRQPPLAAEGQTALHMPAFGISCYQRW